MENGLLWTDLSNKLKTGIYSVFIFVQFYLKYYLYMAVGIHHQCVLSVLSEGPQVSCFTVQSCPYGDQIEASALLYAVSC